MSWDIELAKRFKNTSSALISSDILVGKVLSKSPVSIAIYDGLAKLENQHLYLADGSDTFNYNQGEEVLLATPDGQIFFIINKVKKL